MRRRQRHIRERPVRRNSDPSRLEAQPQRANLLQRFLAPLEYPKLARPSRRYQDPASIRRQRNRRWPLAAWNFANDLAAVAANKRDGPRGLIRGKQILLIWSQNDIDRRSVRFCRRAANLFRYWLARTRAFRTSRNKTNCTSAGRKQRREAQKRMSRSDCSTCRVCHLVCCTTIFTAMLTPRPRGIFIAQIGLVRRTEAARCARGKPQPVWHGRGFPRLRVWLTQFGQHGDSLHHSTSQRPARALACAFRRAEAAFWAGQR